jgi:hypothetical protein
MFTSSFAAGVRCRSPKRLLRSLRRSTPPYFAFLCQKRYGADLGDVAGALKGAGVTFHPDHWDDMLSIVEAYMLNPTPEPITE